MAKGITMDQTHNTIIQWFGNIASVGAILTTMFGIMPAAAAAVALIWYLIQIYESRTVQRYVHAHRIRRIARLKAKLLMLETSPLMLPPGFRDDA